jgi:hypothetical protein
MLARGDKMESDEIKERARFLQHESKTMLVCDLSDLDRDNALKVMRHGQDTIRKMLGNSVPAAGVAHDDLDDLLALLGYDRGSFGSDEEALSWLAGFEAAY